MENLLFLAHRIPYPPNKGDKIRSFHLLKYLSSRYRVFLGAFVDDPEDWRYEATLREMCHEVFLVGITSFRRRMRSLTAFLSGEALSLAYYRHRKMAGWVRAYIRDAGINRVLVYSSPMAQYVLGSNGHDLHRVVDFVDVDSEKWRQYGQRHTWPMSWIYAREGSRLLSFERKVAGSFDASVFVTAQEAQLFQRLAPEVAGRLAILENGVDTTFFAPNRDYSNPYSRSEKALVFTGAMDYWANVDAVIWFAEEVFPHILSQVPEAVFYIVGARPAADVRELDANTGVRVVGAVEDVRPFLYFAHAAVAPLRVARGVQNKVLEAMAMGKPVVATPAAMEGIHLDEDCGTLASDDPNELAGYAVNLLTTGGPEGLGAKGRESVLRHYAWSGKLARLQALLEDPSRRSAIESMQVGVNSL